MATTQLPPDFKEFLKFLNASGAEYLLVGGYAVGFYGYPRATADIDIWIAVSPANAEKIATAFHDFGFRSLQASLFSVPGQGLRIGHPPLRIEVLTEISGRLFESCYERRIIGELDGVEVCVIGRDDLLANKIAAGRFKDLEDVSQLDKGRIPKDPPSE